MLARFIFAYIDWNYFMALFIVFTRKARNGAFSIFINVRQRYPFYLYCQNFTANYFTLDAFNKYFYYFTAVFTQKLRIICEICLINEEKFVILRFNYDAKPPFGDTFLHFYRKSTFIVRI